ncbi:hypothetical protein SY83_13390 [Paenibacillus swuensis]|uniref:Hyaluronate lyase n=1 Tax=Paenibacillus swuensis TaxID=1178515 RepID=A0A172TJA3_9BACL|nr:polysaccharide lyase 8 family protein [Paenibacillus swuensis]ANE47090.1 hypothetical protein SY83_13390 [Paenibacillus swuensis]
MNLTTEERNWNEAMLARWNTLLTGGTEENADPLLSGKIQTINTLADQHWQGMNKAANRTSLWPDLALTLPDHTHAALRRIKEMALAYVLKGSELAGNPVLLSDIEEALIWIYEHRSEPDPDPKEKWWYWEIGMPLQINDICALLYDSLPFATVQTWMEAIHRWGPTYDYKDGRVMTGANRVWKCMILAVQGILWNKPEKLEAAREGLTDVFPTVETSDGFYADGSFIQHHYFAYTGGYGSSLLGNLTKLMFLLDGSRWELDGKHTSTVVGWIDSAFAPLLFRGSMMDMTRGRESSRRHSGGHLSGHEVLSSILLLSIIAEEANALRLRSFAVSMIERDTYRSFAENASLPLTVLAQSLTGDSGIPRLEERSMHKVFASMDRVVHHRPGYAWGLSLSSSRCRKYECINQENLKAWYTADGMLYLYNGDLAHYEEDYWPTVDAYRMPGTTVDTRPREAVSVLYGKEFECSNHWSGGVSLQGTYGASGLELCAEGSELTARKSWFFFDQEMVALGSNITLPSGKAETIIENRKSGTDGTGHMLADGDVILAEPGAVTDLSDRGWFHLERDAATNTGTGYMLLQPASVWGIYEERSGSWHNVNQGSLTSKALLRRNYHTLWIDHGSDPAGASYAYAVLPEVTPSDMQLFAQRQPVEILALTDDVHAVAHHELGITAATFWGKGVSRAAGIACSGPASVMIRKQDNILTVAVSDPTQIHHGVVELTLEESVDMILSLNTGVYVEAHARHLVISVDVSGAAGRTFEARFRLKDK